jgi:predicted nuclease with TOPRIM domain
MRKTATVVHNGTPYSVNIPRFVECCAHAAHLFADNPRLPVPVTDLLDEPQFSVLVTAVNTPNYSPSSATVLSLLKSALVWSSPTFVNLSLNSLLSIADISLIISAIQISHPAGVTFELLEQYSADNLLRFVAVPAFAALPVSVLLRILSWYGAVIPRSPHFVRFVLNSFKSNGIMANFLLEYIHLGDIPASELSHFLRVVDVDIVRDRLIREIPKLKTRDRTKKKRNVAGLRGNLGRLRSDLEALKKRLHAGRQKLGRSEARRKALEDKVGKTDAVYRELTVAIDEMRRKRESLREAVKARKAEKERLVQECEAAQAELEAAKREVERRELERSKESVIKQKVRPLRQYKPEELVAGLQAVDSDFVVALPEMLKEELEKTGDGRCAFLEYLWREVEMKDVEASSCYGALLAVTDELCADLAITILKIAARMGNADALWNLAVLVRKGRGIYGDDDVVAELIAQAANEGQPMAMNVAQKIVGDK